LLAAIQAISGLTNLLVLWFSGKVKNVSGRGKIDYRHANGGIQFKFFDAVKTDRKCMKVWVWMYSVLAYLLK
jgi:hypothetical protein